MNFADFGLGTWHPKGGMYEIIKAMQSVAEELGVTIHTNSPATHILVSDGEVLGIRSKGKNHLGDYVVSGADYHHSETLLDKNTDNIPKNTGTKNLCPFLSVVLYRF